MRERGSDPEDFAVAPALLSLCAIPIPFDSFDSLSDGARVLIVGKSMGLVSSVSWDFF